MIGFTAAAVERMPVNDDKESAGTIFCRELSENVSFDVGIYILEVCMYISSSVCEDNFCKCYCYLETIIVFCPGGVLSCTTYDLRV